MEYDAFYGALFVILSQLNLTVYTPMQINYIDIFNHISGSFEKY